MKYILSVVLLVSCNLLISQNTLEGTVTDANTNQPIAFANVYLPQLEKGSVTDDNGHYTITNLPNGNYKVICSLLGYETFATTLQLPAKSLEISLTPSAVEMEEIILSTPFHKLQSDNVMKVEQANVSDFKANGAVTLADGITNIAGVSSITTGQGIGKPVIRGLSSNRVLVYTQGVRLENQQFGDEHGLGLSDDGVESVEVIKGPASLLYGSDALGGVLYINPERFANANESSASGSFNYYTNTQGINTDLGYKSSGDKFKFLFRGGLESYSDYNTKDYRVTNTRFRSQDFKAGLGYQSTNFKTEFRYNINASKLGIPEELGEQSTDKTPLLPYQELANHVLSSKSTLFFDNSSLDVNLGYIYNDRKEFEEEHDHGDEEDYDEEEHEHEILDPALHMKLKTFNYDVKYNLPTMGKFETIVGIQGMFQENSNYGEEQLIPDANVSDFGALAVSHIHFDKVDVQLGLRYDIRMLETDELDKNFNSFNAALGAKTNLTNNLSLRVNLASGFRAPNLAELTSYGSHEGTGRFEIGDPNLDNEQNIQLDLALEYTSKHIEVFANGFYNLVNNYIYIEPNGELMNEDPVFLYVQNDAKLYGGEAGFHLHPHPLDWLHFESSFETVFGEQDGSDLPLIPATNLNNTLRVEFANNWLKKGYAFTKLSTTFKQDKVSYFETSTDGYSLLSAGLGATFNWKEAKFGVSLTGTNLLDKTYVSHLSRLKPDGIYNIGRNFSIGVNVQI